jgi:hypothetical protein
MKHSSSRRLLVLARALLLVVAGLLAGCDSDVSTSTNLAAAPRTTPLQIRPYRRELLHVDQTDLNHLERLTGPLEQGENNVSLLLHLLRLHGLGAEVNAGNGRSPRCAIDVLTHESLGKEYFGEAPFVRTRTGIRYVTITPTSTFRWNEGHRDQVLACFGELGLSLDVPLVFDQATGSVREVLDDSIANFCLQQRELAWTGVAYSLYLPPTRRWTNRFGDTNSFDDLANALLGFPMVRASCGGTHLAYALAVIARVDEEYPILECLTRERVRERLRNLVEMAVNHQRADGSWTLLWYTDDTSSHKNPIEFEASEDNLLLATAHLAECLLMLPQDIAVPAKCLEASGGWLLRQLKAATLRDKRVQRHCPMTHGLCALRQMAFVQRSARGER